MGGVVLSGNYRCTHAYPSSHHVTMDTLIYDGSDLSILVSPVFLFRFLIFMLPQWESLIPVICLYATRTAADWAHILYSPLPHCTYGSLENKARSLMSLLKKAIFFFVRCAFRGRYRGFVVWWKQCGEESFNWELQYGGKLPDGGCQGVGRALLLTPSACFNWYQVPSLITGPLLLASACYYSASPSHA